MFLCPPEAVANLRLTDSGRSQLAASQQAQQPAARAFALFEQHAASLPHIECAANLARTLSALAELSAEQPLREALGEPRLGGAGWAGNGRCWVGRKWEVLGGPGMGGAGWAGKGRCWVGREGEVLGGPGRGGAGWAGNGRCWVGRKWEVLGGPGLGGAGWAGNGRCWVGRDWEVLGGPGRGGAGWAGNGRCWVGREGEVLGGPGLGGAGWAGTGRCWVGRERDCNPFRMAVPAADCAETLLKREWFSRSGSRETGACYGGRVAALLRLHLAPGGGRLLQRLDQLAQTALAELLEATGREPASETYPTLTK